MKNKRGFASGDVVWLPNSASVGTIIELIDEHTALVDTEGDQIPVDFEFISAQRPVELTEKVVENAKKQRTPVEKSIWMAPPGMQLMFIPEAEGGFLIVLSNHTPNNFLYGYSEIAARKRAGSKNGRIDAGRQIKMGHMEMDRLNDNPSFKIELWHVRDAASGGGTDRPWSREVKLKASGFFKQVAKLESAFNLSGQNSVDGVCFALFEELPPRSDRISAELPKGLRKSEKSFEDSPWREYEALPGNVLAKAMMPDFIDLHAEKLVKHPAKYSAGELLPIQLGACRSFLEKAIVFGLSHIWLVHGFGTGKLKSEIDLMLKNMPEVVRYENSYNHRFGFGATEVFL